MSNPDKHVKKTIAAVATPSGRGGVGVVRVSGPSARDVVEALVPDWPPDQPSHKLRLSRIVAPGGTLLDESLVVLFRGPHSYTGEDVVELQCHGGPIILRGVLDACIATGCRIARPGEFTERAYLNGRLDLTQAEAVADLVNATSEAAHDLALAHLDGALGAEIRHHLERLMEAMALVEAAIDFSHEEHVYQIERDEVLERVDEVSTGLEELRRKFDQGRRKREGVRVVILGPTNAGKSSLFNALVGDDRAIVTEVAGTTRDWLEEELVLGGVSVRIVDTAGLRETSDRVETIGIERSRNLGSTADVVVFVVDASQPLPADVRTELERVRGTGVELVVCANKSDVPRGISAADAAYLSELPTVLSTSFIDATGAHELIATLGDLAARMTSGEGVLLSRTRHLEAVIRAIEALDRTRIAVHDALDNELVALDLRDALDALGAIVGRVSTDDILNKIFGEFCVGK